VQFAEEQREVHVLWSNDCGQKQPVKYLFPYTIKVRYKPRKEERRKFVVGSVIEPRTPALCTRTGALRTELSRPISSIHLNVTTTPFSLEIPDEPPFLLWSNDQGQKQLVKYLFLSTIKVMFAFCIYRYVRINEKVKELERIHEDVSIFHFKNQYN
jgi:hypothetical protein